MDAKAWLVHDVPDGARSAAELLGHSGRCYALPDMNRARGRTCNICAEPEQIVVPAHAGGRAKIPGGNVDRNVRRRRPLHKQEVIRARSFAERIWQVHVAALDREPGSSALAKIGVFNS